jgi:glycosyltransferase involved in cell wall biosynthesis
MHEEYRRKKIAFLTSIDSQDKRSWSGIFYQAAQALQKHCGDVVYIGPSSMSEKKQGWGSWIKTFLLTWFKRVARRYFIYDYHIAVGKKLGMEASQRLRSEQFDIIVAPASLMQVAFLETDIPIIIVEDGTFALLLDYYPQYTRLLPRSIRQMHALTQAGISKASALVYSSWWAAQSAIRDYHANPDNVYVIPMGANLDNPPGREVVQRRKRSERCKLLFVGVDWQRKGGTIAFETLVALEEMGIDAELIICGCAPPRHLTHPHMRVVPYRDKNDPQQLSELEQLYLEADFFLLPTRNECYGIVFCEASAYGLPAITTCTGGVPEVVRDGENGFTLPLEARGDAYARVIAAIYQDEKRYAALVKSSRTVYETSLNWDVWGLHMRQIIDDLTGCREAITENRPVTMQDSVKTNA